jgi:hypothetical protein
MSAAVRASEIKIKLFYEESGTADVCNFSSCDLLHKYG